MELCKGDVVIYTKTGESAIIIAIHYDDVPPYYTIKMKEREIQTVPKYLKKSTHPKKTLRNKKSHRKSKRKNMI